MSKELEEKYNIKTEFQGVKLPAELLVWSTNEEHAEKIAVMFINDIGHFIDSDGNDWIFAKLPEPEPEIVPFTQEDFHCVASVIQDGIDCRVSDYDSERVGYINNEFCEMTYKEIMEERTKGRTFEGELINLYHEKTNSLDKVMGDPIKNMPSVKSWSSEERDINNKDRNK